MRSFPRREWEKESEADRALRLVMYLANAKDSLPSSDEDHTPAQAPNSPSKSQKEVTPGKTAACASVELSNISNLSKFAGIAVDAVTSRSFLA